MSNGPICHAGMVLRARWNWKPALPEALPEVSGIRSRKSCVMRWRGCRSQDSCVQRLSARRRLLAADRTPINRHAVRRQVRVATPTPATAAAMPLSIDAFELHFGWFRDFSVALRKSIDDARTSRSSEGNGSAATSRGKRAARPTTDRYAESPAVHSGSLSIAEPLLAGLPGCPRVRAVEPRQAGEPHIEVAELARRSLPREWNGRGRTGAAHAVAGLRSWGRTGYGPARRVESWRSRRTTKTMGFLRLRATVPRNRRCARSSGG